MDGLIHEIGFDVQQFEVLAVPTDKTTGWFFGDPGDTFADQVAF